MGQHHLGEERVYLSLQLHSPMLHWREVGEGTQGRNLDTGANVDRGQGRELLRCFS